MTIDSELLILMRAARHVMRQTGRPVSVQVRLCGWAVWVGSDLVSVALQPVDGARALHQWLARRGG